MERQKRLSQAFIKGVKQPGRYGDGRGGYGLSLVVRTSADGGLNKSYVQQLRRADRSTVNLGLGSSDSTTLQAARERALDNFRRLRNNEEVRQPRGLPPAKVMPTLREVAERWLDVRRTHWKGEGNERLARQRLANHVAPLLDVRVNRITRQNILDTLLSIQATPTRDRVQKVIHGIMGHAVLREWRLDNPVDDALRAALATKRQPKHHKSLASGAITDALAKADARDGWAFVPMALRFIALTATRNGEARGARWDEFDLTLRIWHVPAERMKASKAFDVPLSLPALNVLRRAKELIDGSGLVFPSPRGTVMDGGRLSEAMRFCGDTTVHGLRSSFRTWAAEEGIERDVAEMVLAHALGTSTELAYKRTDYFQRRVEVMERWAAVVEELESQGQTAAA